MTRYPSETSLTVNAVGEMVRRIDGDRFAAIGPTQPRAAEDEHGYPIQHAAATRVTVQVRAPQYRHAERGPCFELTPGAIGTLSMREVPGAAVLACPGVEGMGDLSEALAVTRFVSVHAIRTDTSRLFVPPEGPVTAKVRDAADGEGFDRDPANYYPLPAGAVYTWSELADRITDRHGDLRIRSGGTPTDRYRGTMERLETLQELYPRPNPQRATPTPREAVDDAGAARLIDHALAGYEEAYTGAGPRADPAGERAALEAVVASMRATRDPSLFRIRRAIELIYEVGERTATTMNVGAIDDAPTDASDNQESRRSAAATTLADFR